MIEYKDYDTILSYTCFF